jgi:hypothetical protein
MHRQHLNEDSLKAGDLRFLVNNEFEIDSYKSKMGDDKDVVVLSFTVESNEPAKDLVSFIEKGYQFVLDADMTPGELADGKYRVFIELERSEAVVEQILNLLYGIQKLSEVDDFKFKYHKSFDSHQADQQLLSEVIPATPEEYETRIQEIKTESYNHFFANSMLENISMQNNILQFKKIYADPVKMRYLKSGPTKQVLESINDKISIKYTDIAEVMYLTKYIGHYNITKLGENKFVFENKGHAVLLEKLNGNYI